MTVSLDKQIRQKTVASFCNVPDEYNNVNLMQSTVLSLCHQEHFPPCKICSLSLPHRIKAKAYKGISFMFISKHLRKLITVICCKNNWSVVISLPCTENWTLLVSFFRPHSKSFSELHWPMYFQCDFKPLYNFLMQTELHFFTCCIYLLLWADP